MLTSLRLGWIVLGLALAPSASATPLGFQLPESHSIVDIPLVATPGAFVEPGGIQPGISLTAAAGVSRLRIEDGGDPALQVWSFSLGVNPFEAFAVNVLPAKFDLFPRN